MFKKIMEILALSSPAIFALLMVVIHFDLWNLETALDDKVFELVSYFSAFVLYVIIARDAWDRIKNN